MTATVLAAEKETSSEMFNESLIYLQYCRHQNTSTEIYQQLELPTSTPIIII